MSSGSNRWWTSSSRLLKRTGSSRWKRPPVCPLGTSDQGDLDPHFWLDPVNVIGYVENIRDALTQADPAGEAEYAANAEAYIAELQELDSWIASQVEQIPPERRLLVTNHESFGYFADRYGFEVVGTVLGTGGAGGAPSAQQLASLVAAIEGSGAPAIFLEAGSNTTLAEQVAREAGVQVVTDLLHAFDRAGRTHLHRHDALERQAHSRGLAVSDLLEVRDVTVAYGNRLALDSVSLVIPHAAQVAVVGPNGAGKSTLFKAMMGLLPMRTGEMLIHGRPVGEYRDPIAYVPQREDVDWRFPVTVHDVVAMGRYGRRGWLRRLSAEDREVVQALLGAHGHPRPGREAHRGTLRWSATEGLPCPGTRSGAAHPAPGRALHGRRRVHERGHPRTAGRSQGERGHGARLHPRSRTWPRAASTRWCC